MINQNINYFQEYEDYYKDSILNNFVIKINDEYTDCINMFLTEKMETCKNGEYLKKLEKERIEEELRKQKELERQRLEKEKWSYNGIKNNKYKLGDMGRLYIPDFKLSVALYKDSFFIINDCDWQCIVDRPDSALMYTNFDSLLIGDHNYQGFNKIKNSIPNKTILLIKNESGLKQYKCIANFKGHNNVYNITNNDNIDIMSIYKNKLILYTCNENWKNITIVVWEEI